MDRVIGSFKEDDNDKDTNTMGTLVHQVMRIGLPVINKGTIYIGKTNQVNGYNVTWWANITPIELQPDPKDSNNTIEK